MKQDIAVFVDPATGDRDIAIGLDKDLLSVEGFDTSIDLSILTNRRANESQVAKAQYRRGWIGDLVSNTSWLVGSLLWLYEQRRLDAAVLRSIEDSAQKALQWLVNIGSASTIGAFAEQTGPHSVRLTVDLRIGKNIVKRYFNLWGNTSI